jgi:uncharacterized membrane protein
VERNLDTLQRLSSAVAGFAFIIRGLKRPSSFGVILGMMGISLVYRGASGYCPVFDAMRLHTNTGSSQARSGDTIVIRQTIVIHRPPAEIYRFWRCFGNLPRIMSHLRSVFVINDRLSYWVVQTSAGARNVEWGTEIIHDTENERIDWHSLADADIDHTGSLDLTPGGNGHSTQLTLTLQYALPTGLSHVAVAEILGEDPERSIAQDLQRFKKGMEDLCLGQGGDSYPSAITSANIKP